MKPKLENKVTERHLYSWAAGNALYYRFLMSRVFHHQEYLK